MGLEDFAGPAFDPTQQSESHPVLHAFVAKRSASPLGQERTQRVSGDVYNLHAQNPWRGVTWWDEQQRVCWLLAVSPHDYDLFETRSANNELAPTVGDYADLATARDPAGLDSSRERFLVLASKDAQALTSIAFAEPNTEVTGCLAATLDTSIFVEMMVVEEASATDVYVGFTMPPHPGFALPEDLIMVCIGLVLPDADLSDLDFHHDYFPRAGGRQANEVVVRWRRPDLD